MLLPLDAPSGRNNGAVGDCGGGWGRRRPHPLGAQPGPPGSGRTVGISELGALLKEDSQILAVIRNGNHLGTAIVGLKVPRKKGAGWDSVDVDTFGFKATYRMPGESPKD